MILRYESRTLRFSIVASTLASLLAVGCNARQEEEACDCADEIARALAEVPTCDAVVEGNGNAASGASAAAGAELRAETGDEGSSVDAQSPFGELDIRGAIDAAELHGFMLDKLDDLNACEPLPETVLESNVLSAHFIVFADGSTGSVRFATQPEAPTLERCLGDVVRSWRLPRPEDRRVARVRFDFTLATNEQTIQPALPQPTTPTPP